MHRGTSRTEIIVLNKKKGLFMAVYAISDLHLSLGVDKPMDIFGEDWSDHMKKLKNNWMETVGRDDSVIIAGDISWATYLEQAAEDFMFIESLPGRKIISKGNHDYWWTTRNKLEGFLEKKGLKSISFLHNNSYRLGKLALCGTRGWKCPGDDEFSPEDKKIYERELQRLELSLKHAGDCGDGLIVAMHYPPFNSLGEPSGFVRLMEKYRVKKCIYGHLHGEGFKNAFTGEYGGIDFRLVSADYLKFKPVRLD